MKEESRKGRKTKERGRRRKEGTVVVNLQKDKSTHFCDFRKKEYLVIKFGAKQCCHGEKLHVHSGFEHAAHRELYFAEVLYKSCSIDKVSQAVLDRKRLQGPGNSSCGFTHSQGHLEVKLHSHWPSCFSSPRALPHTDRTDLVYPML